MTESTASPNPAASAPSALVVYASTHGHTAKIAGRIARVVGERGLAVDVLAVANAAGVDPGSYDVVVVGGSLHRGHHQQDIADWVSARRAALERRPSVFFSVSLAAADDSAQSRAAARDCIDEFCAQTGWTPGQTEAIAGCLQYREYDPFTRQLMRLLMRHGHHPTDASRDYDYTDWRGVDRLGREIAELAGVPVGA